MDRTLSKLVQTGVISYDSAREYAKDWISDYHTGSEILEMSNPGDYPYDEDEKVRYRVIKSRK